MFAQSGERSPQKQRQFYACSPLASNRQIAANCCEEALADIKNAEIEKLKKQFQRVADTVEFDGYKYDKVAHTT
jgi:hypothetical protein